MTSPQFLATASGRRIAYHRSRAAREGACLPGVTFLGGYASDMTGTKATWLQAWAEARGRAFLRFDYSGHGASSGAFRDGCVGDWAADAAEALARLTEGPQILVGSSMGGWIATLLARETPERVAGLVGVAAAPDFTERLMWPGLDAEARARLAVEGEIAVPNPYGETPGVITRRLIEDGREQLVLTAPLRLPFPVRLLHGTADADVPVWLAQQLLDHLDSPDAQLTLVKGADHRFSGPAELALIGETIEALG